MADGPFPASASVSPALLWKEEVRVASSPTPAPTQSPLSPEHKGPTQPTATHSWAQGIHGEACARGVRPPLRASLGVGPLAHLLP